MTAVGLTSRWVAANRVLETEHVQPLYRDPYARELAGEAGFDVLYTMRALAGMGTFVGPDPFLTIRTRFFDDTLLSAVREGIDQVVILAAGMDARAFRLDWPAGVRLYEIDRDDVFAHKEPTLARLQAQPVCDRRIVRQDLAQPWTRSLDEAGFDRSRRTAFLAEGLLYYLDEPAAVALVDAISAIAAPGSRLAFDAMNPEVLSSPFIAPYLKKLAELGCPWQFGLRDPDDFMAARGWRSSYVLPGEPDANYGRWIMPVLPRTMPGFPRTYLIRAARVTP
jgi:methyltransferase (TIGR00027 family)